MENPQHVLSQETSRLEIGRKTSWAVTFVFLFLLVVPVLWKQVGTFVQSFIQRKLLEIAVEGNEDVLVGYDGWLFDQTEVHALTGFGPLRVRGFNATRNPQHTKATPIRESILQFAAELKAQGINFLLVPVPTKPMLYGEYVNPNASYTWITHPDASTFYAELREQGIDVLDLTSDLASLRTKRKHIFVRVPDRKDKEAIAEAEEDAKKLHDVFHQQSSFLTPEAMRLAAERVSDHLQKAYPFSEKYAIRAVDGVSRSEFGNLVSQLKLASPETFFDPENVFLRVIGDGTESADSPLVLLGGDLLRIYDDPELGYANPENPEAKIHAGFAQHLSLLLQHPLDVVPQSGIDTEAILQKLNRDEWRDKKLVVWLVSARDLFLNP